MSLLMRMRLLHFISLVVMGTWLMGQFEGDTLRYEDGTIKAIGATDEHGQKVSVWVYYYPSGVKSSRFFFLQGEQMDGPQLYYAPNGQLIAHEHWEDDLQQDSSWYWYPNGNLEKKGAFKDGLYEGDWVFYYEDGTMKRKGTYVQGAPDGIWCFYFENGQLNQQGRLKQGKESGLWRYFDEEGNMIYEGSWKDGEKRGQWYYYKKGKKKAWKYFD